MSEKKTVRVVAGIVVEAGRVLIAQRPRPQSFALRWEFPGGKMEPGESPEDALDREFQEELGIRIFDPEGETARVLRENRVPFEEVALVDAIGMLRDGLLIIGEGVSFRDYRGLAGASLAAAARGVPVLCLASTGGTVPLPNLVTDERGGSEGLLFRRESWIRSLDKRLDALAWPGPAGERIQASGISLEVDGKRVAATISRGSEGWPFVEVAPQDGGATWIFCGLAVVSRWDDGPTPRYLLAQLLAYLSKGD